MSLGKIVWHREYTEFRRKLIQARKEAGLSQREVSAQMGKVPSWTGKCETGERRVDVVELVHLARLYEKPLAFFSPLQD